MTAAKKRVPFQQVTIEYRVMGELDGETLAPDVQLDPTQSDYEIDDRGIHVVDVPGNLGLIDPDFIGPAVQGDRCIPWVYIDSPAAGVAASNFSVVDNTPNDLGVPVPALQLLRFATLGLPVFYSDHPTTIPQGSALAVMGYPSGEEKIVRINVVAPQDAEEYAAVIEACCCSADLCEEPPSIQSFSGPAVSFVPGTSQYVFTGTNVGDAASPFQYVWLQTTDNRGEPATSGQVAGEGQTFGAGNVTVDYDPPADTPPGQYRLVVFDEADPSCNSGRPGSSIQFWPADCPVFEDPQTNAPFNLTLDGGSQVFSVDGFNLDGGAVATIRLLNDDTGVAMKNVTFIAVSPTQIDVTANPTSVAPADQPGDYSIELVPTDPDCPDQLVSGVSLNP